MKGKTTSISRGQNGMALVIVLILILMMSLIGIGSIMTSMSEMDVADNELKQTGAFYIAESGLEKAAAEISERYETAGVPPNPLPSGALEDNIYSCVYSVADGGAAVQTTLTEGAYRGLYGLVKSFEISSVGTDADRESAVTLSLGMQDALIPLFQFAVFYENDLEIAPGPNMTLGGRVHSNQNVYLQSGLNLFIESYLTSASNIFHGRKPGSGQSETNGNVLIRDRNNVYQDMRNLDGTWLDSRSGDWVHNSIARWNGQVEDSDHGFSQLNMPVVVDGATTDLIDRGSGNNDSFEHKAGLKFIDGQALYLQNDGTWIDVTSNLVTSGVMTQTTFYDAREQQQVLSLDLDLQRLGSSGYFPGNGIIYSSFQPSFGVVTGLRLQNGAELRGALTVATDNPMYTAGNYNTVNKKPAALIADAITVLSSNWSDARSEQNIDNRLAVGTQINACFMTGNTETGANGQEYNGGLENLPRFLEKWTDRSFVWRGAMVDLWYSRQATGEWSYGRYYTAPNRDWAFDPSLLDIANLPPGTPMVNIVQRTHWRQVVGQNQEI